MDDTYERQGLFAMTDVESDVEDDIFLQDEEERAEWLSDFEKYKERVGNFDL